MNFQNAVFNFELQPSQIRGLAEGELAAKRGLLLIEAGKYDLSAAIIADLKADELAANFEGFASFDNNTANRFRFLSEAAKLSFADAIWQFDLDKQAANIYNTDVFISGQAELASLEDFNLDLFINSELADLALKGEEENLNFVLNTQNTRFVGLANVLEKSFLASAKLADLDLNIDGFLGADGVQARANLHNSQDELILLLNGPIDINKLKFDLGGQINVHDALKLAQQYSFLEGLDLSSAEGILKPKISYQNSIASGDIAFEGSYLNYPLRLNSIISKNQELNYSGQTTIQGQSIDLSGQAYPKQSLVATNDLGRVEVFRDDLANFLVAGQGTSPELSYSDWKINEQDWQLSGNFQELDLKLGESKLKFKIIDDSWQVFAEINQKARQANQELQLVANFNSSKENFDGQILGTLFYENNNSSLEIPFSGSLASLDFAKKLSAKDLLALTAFDFEILGDLELVGNIKPKTQEYNINGFWLTGNERIELELAGVAAEWQARAYSPNIQASYQASNLNLDLNNFDPNKFISTYPPNYKLRGQMSYDNELGWTGSFSTANSLNFNNIIIPLNLTAIGAGKRIELAGQTIIQNKDIALSGQIYPKIDIKASNDLGEIFLKQKLGEFSLSGGGEIAQIKSQGWLSKAHAWTLTGDLQDVHIALGQSEFDFSWQNSNWQLAGTLNEKILQDDKEIDLWADISLSKEKPNGEILGNISYKENGNYLELPISGSLELIGFSAKKPAKELLQLAGFDFDLWGDV